MSPTGFPYLYLRGSVYYFRIRIPADLIFCFDGRREIRLSLRTKEPHLAHYRAMRTLVAVSDIFARLRNEAGGGDA